MDSTTIPQQPGTDKKAAPFARLTKAAQEAPGRAPRAIRDALCADDEYDATFIDRAAFDLKDARSTLDSVPELVMKAMAAVAGPGQIDRVMLLGALSGVASAVYCATNSVDSAQVILESEVER